jgi:hypothetical protein
MVARVANGFLGECVAGGKPAVCTSSDSLTWSLKPDPAIFALAGSGSFAGWSIAHADAGWVAVGTYSAGAWFSADGVTWTSVGLKLKGVQAAHVQRLGNGFAMVASVLTGDFPTTQVLLSSDGRSWSPAQWPGGTATFGLAGVVGVVAHEQTEPAEPAKQPAVSADGVNWTSLELPTYIHDVVSTVRIPGGGYAGLGTGLNGGPGWLITSTDGITWQYSTGIGPRVESLALVGDRLVAISRIQGTDTEAIWESSGAVEWRRLAVLDGKSISATEVVEIGGRIGLLDGGRPSAVAVIVEGAEASPSPSPAAPSASPSSADTTDSFVIGGWRWHKMNLTPDGAVLHLPNGYLGRCGDSMCTSRNGWSWQLPPDPVVFDADSTVLFTPVTFAGIPGGNSVIQANEGIWYSVDGRPWQLSALPTADAPVDLWNLEVGPQGFALTADMPNPSNAAVDVRCDSYVSADGAVWTDSGTIPCVIGYSNHPDGSVPIFGQAVWGASQGEKLFSGDGRTWSQVSVPEGVATYSDLNRFSDGSLVAMTLFGPMLRSNDGLTWTPVTGGWATEWTKDNGQIYLNMAVAGDHILVEDMLAESGAGAMWESSDRGVTFHRWMGSPFMPTQFADLVMAHVDADGSNWVGAPLPASDTPGTTPPSTNLPVSSPMPTASQAVPPAGGISQQEAIRIAARYLHAPAGAKPDSVSATFEGEYGRIDGRWIWTVDFHRSISAENWVEMDYFTGDILVTGSGVE